MFNLLVSNQFEMNGLLIIKLKAINRLSVMLLIFYSTEQTQGNKDRNESIFQNIDFLFVFLSNHAYSAIKALYFIINYKIKKLKVLSKTKIGHRS